MLTRCYQLRDVPISPRGELRRLLDSINRRRLLVTGVRLFCFECQRVQQVREVFTSSRICELACQHRRSLATGGQSDLLETQIAKLETAVEQAEEQHGEEIG